MPKPKGHLVTTFTIGHIDDGFFVEGGEVNHLYMHSHYTVDSGRYFMSQLTEDFGIEKQKAYMDRIEAAALEIDSA